MSFANAGGGSCENFILSIFLMTTKPRTRFCVYRLVFLCLFWDFGPESNSRVNKRQAFIPKQHKSTARERKRKKGKGVES